MEDKNGNQYENVSNVRITYVSKSTRSGIKDWSSGDVLRICAYKNTDSESLNLGPEIDLYSPETILELIEALCRLYRAHNNAIST